MRTILLNRAILLLLFASASQIAFAASTNGESDNNPLYSAPGMGTQGQDVLETPMESMPEAENKMVMAFDSEVITFKAGDSQLTEDAKVTINGLVDRLKVQGSLGTAKLVVWSDAEMPMQGQLAKKDKDLAQARARTLEKYLKEQTSISQVRVFDMTHRKHWVGRMYRRAQKDIDATFSRKGKRPLSQAEFKVIQDQGGASKAVLIIENATSK